jgi:hypothetical protein
VPADQSLVGSRRLPPPWLLLLAALGATFLVTFFVYRAGQLTDEHAYWLAANRLVEGKPLYDPTATSVTPYAYWYPPVLAQVLVPVALVVPPQVFGIAWTAMQLACLWWLAGRNVLVALALIAFPPVAVEVWSGNVHLILTVLLVMGIRGRVTMFPIGAAIKIAPGLGIPWLLAKLRWRDAGFAIGAGLAILVVSVVLSPQAWMDWLETMSNRGPDDVAALLPIPYVVRAVAGLLLALVAGRLRAPWDGVVLVVAVTIAMPTLWATALSTLVAIVPLVVGYRASSRPQSASYASVTASHE